MRKNLYILMPLLLLFMLSACGKPNHHPKNPNYRIEKPSVKYKPSAKNLDKMVKKLQGSPYVWAEEGPNNFDCSGFTYYLYGSMGIEIPRVARHQALRGEKIDVKNLQYGDLIFFATNKRSRRKITHVGMYMGDGWFTHASTVKHEVIYTNLFTSNYYKNRLRVCRRYLPKVDITKDPEKETAPWASVEKEPIVTTDTVKPVIKTLPTLPLPKEATVTNNENKKAIVIQAPLKEIEQSSAKGNFFVQVGSFVGSPNTSILANIAQHGYSHKIIRFNRGTQKISKLLIGPYIQRSQALIALEKVKRNIQKDAFIAEIR